MSGLVTPAKPVWLLQNGGALRHSTVLILLSLAGAALAQRAEYEGPTILSRGAGTIMRGGGELVRLRPYVHLNGVYDSGLTPVSVDAQGNIPEDDAYGVEAGVGVLGYHTWKDTILGLDYRGNFRHYTRHTYYDGTDQLLSLGVTHQLSRRVTFSLRESAGTYSRSFGALSAYDFFDPAFANIPSNELFDGRTYYLSTMGDLTFDKSPRLSFNVGGSGLVVRRRSRALIGVTGWTARGDTAYRVSRRHAIGVDYFFTHYDFTNAFGASDIQALAWNWSARLGRYWDFGLRIGAARVETLGLRRVAIDPIVAAIIGQTTGIEAFYRLNYVPNGDIRLSRVFRRSRLSFDYSRGTHHGNGLYLTSQFESAGMGYSHTAFRRWNVGVSAGYDSYSSLGQSIGKYRGARGGVGITCQLSHSMHLVSRFDVRRLEVEHTTFQREHYRVTVGLAYSPGDLPLSLW